MEKKVVPIKFLYLSDHGMLVGRVKWSEEQKGKNIYTIYNPLRILMQGLKSGFMSIPVTILTLPENMVVSVIRESCIDASVVENWKAYEEALSGIKVVKKPGLVDLGGKPI